ncbi:MAG: hypothetical protein A2W91_11310 [Bacteroidetes bacterium GWF2_38_335]|nr:MAG: hypothetical protein A2W91_11310 [Bacteroidetes bacterium GWF2_38_335]OFY81715.1 MAG: hypothetical protein A2281_05730 [Bacteroidetes bacterium RIFOXYA12_FULL_38_20]HBS87779.1 hypothetical protein [Bacteroidales bacterium]
MEHFLYRLAEKVYNDYKSSLSEVCLVFPNRRAGLFFNKHLTGFIDKPVWAPSCISIDNLMRELSVLKNADDLALVYELFKVYKEKTNSQESFDNFYFWGEMLLRDFNDIDKHLVNAADLFMNLKSVKSIEDQFSYLTDEQIDLIKRFWTGFNPERESAHKTSFIGIWEVLSDIYSGFKSVLTKKGWAYEGMIYRDVAEKIQRNETLSFDFSRYIVAGFNALNRCEEILFEELNKRQIVDLYWDYDPYYMDDPDHEAGYFLRKNLKFLPEKEVFVKESGFVIGKKNIEFISAPNDTIQINVVHDILKNEQKVSKESTAVVLCNENLLPSLIGVIPENISDFNITMGYPADYTPVKGLLDMLLKLQKNAGKNKEYYYRDVTGILNHQYVISHNPELYKEISDDIIRFNRIGLTDTDLHRDDLLKMIFRKTENPADFSSYLLELLQFIHTDMGTDNAGVLIEKEFIFRIYTGLNRLNDLIVENNIAFDDISLYYQWVRKIISGIKVPFTGEPLKGLQIMGILETRLLDFDRIIMVSMNEGVMPVSGSASSFIPYNLRKGFGMPTIEEMDAIYAYYFYRAVQRAQNIHLIYNTSRDSKQTGEMSRYLYQLKYETDLPIAEKKVVYNLLSGRKKPVTIKKTGDVFNKLMEFARQGSGKYISPSALNSYIDCSLKFYFRQIAEIYEPDEVTEEIDGAVFGNIFHEAMQILYTPFIGKTVNAVDLEKILLEDKMLDAVLKKSFKNIMLKKPDEKGEFEIEGRNKLIFNVLKKYIKGMLRIDLNHAPFDLVSLEEKYRGKFEIEVNGEKITPNLYGKTDRIDSREGIVRIIDYKTGGDSNSFKSIDEMFDSSVKKRPGAVLQTFLYCENFISATSCTDVILPQVFKIKTVYSDKFEPGLKYSPKKGTYIPVGNYNEYRNDFRNAVCNTLKNIFDRGIDFSQTEIIEKCEKCPYSGICF